MGRDRSNKQQAQARRRTSRTTAAGEYEKNKKMNIQVGGQLRTWIEKEEFPGERISKNNGEEEKEKRKKEGKKMTV